MDPWGNHKAVAPDQPLDLSIYADSFVVVGMARYAIAARDEGAYRFAKRLLDSCLERIDSGRYHTLPYPLSSRFRAHGIPMIFNDTTREVVLAARSLTMLLCPGSRPVWKLLPVTCSTTLPMKTTSCGK